MGKSAIIVAKNLSVGYSSGRSSKIVFSNAKFSINRGEFVGVLGPNGAGKTTLIKLLLGLIKPLRGEINIFNECPKCGNSKIGYVPQHHSFDSELMIEAAEIVRLGLSGHKLGFSWPKNSRAERAEALDVLNIVGAGELAHRPLSTLSGGELQRIFLAQALIGKPDILLLDEPLASLDMRREREFVKLIKDTAVAHNITVFLIAHNVNPLLSVLSRVIYVANGRVAVGDPGDVLNSESLTKLYSSPVEVLHDSHGRIVVVGAEEGAHHEAHHKEYE